jgi:rubrerythrin
MDKNKALDVLKSALLLEKRGKAFYAKAAEETKNPGVKDIFLAMSKEEDLHVAQLTAQFQAVQKTGKFLPLDQIQGTNTVSTEVLDKNLMKQINAASFEAAAISAAMMMEERAIKTYADRAREATDANEKAMYQWLVDWEKDHLRHLVSFDEELKEQIWNDAHFWPM